MLLNLTGTTRIELSAGDVYEMMRLGVDLSPKFLSTVVGRRYHEAAETALKMMKENYLPETIHLEVVSLSIQPPTIQGNVLLNWQYNAFLPMSKSFSSELSNEDLTQYLSNYTNLIARVYQSCTTRAAFDQFESWKIC